MHIEQDRCCELCLQLFTIEYEYAGKRLPSTRDTITMMLLPCPRCGHANPVHLVPYAGNIVCKRLESPKTEPHAAIGPLRMISSTRTV